MASDRRKLQDAGVMGYYTAGVSPYGFQYTMFQPNTSNTTSTCPPGGILFSMAYQTGNHEENDEESTLSLCFWT
jgi:hypothetical protein